MLRFILAPRQLDSGIDHEPPGSVASFVFELDLIWGQSQRISELLNDVLQTSDFRLHLTRRYPLLLQPPANWASKSFRLARTLPE